MNEIPEARFPLLQSIGSVCGHPVPPGARPIGYAALVAAYGLEAPAPDALFAVSDRHTLRTEGRWFVLTPRYRPGDILVAHLGFALRHEAVDLGLLAALFRHPEAAPAITDWVRRQPSCITR